MSFGHRGRSLLITVTVSVLLAGAGMTASMWVKSPQQLAAEAATPARTKLTAPVERRILRQTVVIRGDVAAARSVQITPTAKDGAKAIVTAVKVATGGNVKAGAVLLEVGGRPLVALPGDRPAYRDLRPGYSGPDVRQLQAALAALGHDPHESTGYFGEGTKDALRRFYTSIGYPVLPTSEDDDRQLAAADRQVTEANRAVEDATDSVAKARAMEDLRAATAARDALRRSTGPMLALSEYVFLPSFPARVDNLKAEVGIEVAMPLVTLSSGPLHVKARFGPAHEGALKPGLSVEIISEALGITAQGKVDSVGDLVVDEKTGDSGYPIIVKPDTALPAKLAGQNVRLTIAAAATPGEVLVVPVSALFAAADGTVGVVRVGPSGDEERITVIPGMSGDGYVEVTGALTAGDQVMIGAQPT